MSPPLGKQLERLVAAIQYAESTGAVVTWNDTIDGRQFDVTVRFKYGLHSYLTVIECKDYASKVPVEKVDALATKSRDVGANKAILISARGFQAGCFPVAERHGIELLVLTESSTPTAQDLIARITPALNVYDVSFVATGTSSPILFEDWGGRLGYLMNQSQVVVPEGTKPPNQLVYEWQLAGPTLDPENENVVELPLREGSELRQPHEEPVEVSAMRFKCAFVEAIVPKVPLADTHVMAGLSSRVDLHDAKGKLVHSMRMGEVPLGFDTSVTPGEFYELPHLFNRYHCDKIEGDLVTWTLLESYQHGHLVQATFTQKLQFAKYYIPVTDSKIRRRLESMLSRLRGRR